MMEPEVNAIEGYFCKWSIPSKVDYKKVTNNVRINVFVGAKIGSETLYNLNILTFSINLAHNIKVGG